MSTLQTVPARLVEVVEHITVDPSLTKGRVLMAEVEAESPRNFRHALSRQLYMSLHAGIVGDPVKPPSLTRRGDRDIQMAIDEATAACPRRLEVVSQWQEATGPDGAPGAVVLLDRVRVFVPGERLERREDTLLVSRHTVQHRLSIGFSFFTSASGMGTRGDLLRLYRHGSSPEELLEVWRRLVEWGQQTGIPFRMKMLSERFGYPRNDALVVYLPQEAWGWLDRLAALVASENPLAETSPFVHEVAPGVGWAWEPEDRRPSGVQRSFGEHRCRVLADALVAARRQNRPWQECWVEACHEANVDPVDPGRNLDSPRLEEPC